MIIVIFTHVSDKKYLCLFNNKGELDRWKQYLKPFDATILHTFDIEKIQLDMVSINEGNNDNGVKGGGGDF